MQRRIWNIWQMIHVRVCMYLFRYNPRPWFGISENYFNFRFHPTRKLRIGVFLYIIIIIINIAKTTHRKSEEKNRTRTKMCIYLYRYMSICHRVYVLSIYRIAKDKDNITGIFADTISSFITISVMETATMMQTNRCSMTRKSENGIRK